MVKGKLICGYKGEGMGWFRVLGYGLSWKDLRIHPRSFPERLNCIRFFQLGPFLIRFLPRKS